MLELRVNDELGCGLHGLSSWPYIVAERSSVQGFQSPNTCAWMYHCWLPFSVLEPSVMLIDTATNNTAPAVYPMTQILWYRVQPKYETAMGLSLYVTLGI